MTKTINFNDLGRGTVVDNEYAAKGVTVSAFGGSGKAMIFDTANPTGGDHDLETHNLGKVLIISEDGDSHDPDDEAHGGTLRFDFHEAADVKSLTFLDIEEGATVKFYDDHGALIATRQIHATGNNGQRVEHFNVEGAARMDVILNGSGAIDNLVFEDSGPELDGIVEGTAGNDVIDGGYTGDPEGDRVDANDQILAGEGVDDDIIVAKGGDDVVRAGNGNDDVFGGSGDDSIDGGAGHDSIEGNSGDDIIKGGAGNDVLIGDGDGAPDESTEFNIDWDQLGSDGNQTLTVDGQSVNVSIATPKNAEGKQWFVENGMLKNWDVTKPATADMHFDTEVSNVQFTLLDVDGLDKITIMAKDANGNLVPVSFENTGVHAVDGNMVVGTQTNDPGPGANNNAQDIDVTIEGPIKHLWIVLDNGPERAFSGTVAVSDITFEIPADVTGEDGDDSIHGGDGDDIIMGNGGDDVITGDAGNDEIDGGDGDDMLFGGDGDDHISGGAGNDKIEASKGDDSIDGGAGDDDLWGGLGNDVIKGGAGNDSINAGPGDDMVFAGTGDDNIQGGAGNDKIEASAGNDVIDGGDGDDDLWGGLGDDTIISGAGADIVRGGNDADVIFGSAGDNVDGGAGGNDHDTLDLTGQGAFYLDNVVEDSNGNGIDGTVVFVDAHGVPTGETIDFTEIEKVIGEEVNRGPDAVDDMVTMDEDTMVTIDVLGNDTDPDGDTLTVISAVSPDGEVTINADGTLKFTPNENFNGMTTVDYTISDGNGGTDTAWVKVTVNAVNDAPDAVDDTSMTDEDTSVIVDLLANDTDVDGDTLMVTNVSVPADQGTVVDNGDGTATFTPADGFNGTAMISYDIKDGNGGRDWAKHFVEVKAVNDGPVATDDADSTDQNTAIALDNVLGNDTDEDGDTLEVFKVDGAEGNLGTPVAASAGGLITINADGSASFDPNGDFDGLAVGETAETSVTYMVSDGNGGMDTATVTVTVNGLNDAPDAVDDMATVDEGEMVIINVLANDTDIDGDDLTIIKAVSPKGEVEILDDGTLKFTPEAGFTGMTTVDYVVSDGNGGTDKAWVKVTVVDTNDGPTATDNSYNFVPSEAAGDVDGNVLTDDTGNGVDSDPDGDALSVVAVGGAAAGVGAPVAGDNGGLFTINADGTVDFDANGEFEGLALGETAETSVTYTISDGNGGTDTATVTFAVEGINDGTVQGTDGDDVIIPGYVDADGDIVDAEDNILPGKGPNDDVIVAGAGNDKIEAGLGDDMVFGGTGDDSINGDVGDDMILGEDGDDVIRGGAGNDSIDAGEGDDMVFAGTGDDVIEGGDGNDKIEASAGNDVISGGAGDDDIWAGKGDDTVHGGNGDDTIVGGPGNDMLFSGNGDDIVFGGDGDDKIETSKGSDQITGGDGADNIWAGLASDTIFGGNGGDRVKGGEDADGSDVDVLDLTGSNVDFITYDENDPEAGVVTFLDGSTMTFSEIENVIPCFTPGTTIATPKGERLVEELTVGDRIITRDNGIQEIAWVGHKSMDGKQLAANPHLKPILIKAGSLGDGLPERDMLVSPNHRVLVASEMTQLYFEEREVLAAAKHMTGAQGIHAVDVMATTYIHFMFEKHEVVLSNGAWTESFQPGDYSLKGIGNSQRNEIFELFPELATKGGLEDYQSARKALKKHEAKLLMK